jgi:prepilin-type processing-associated H-X9-DG protein
MLLPALSTSREMAKRSVCQSSLRQVIFVANTLYTDDYNGYLPNGGSVVNAIEPYINPKFDPLHHETGMIWNGCPSKSSRETPKYLNDSRSYGWNQCLGTVWTWKQIKLSQVRNPSNVCGFIDCTSENFNGPTHYETYGLEQGRHLSKGLNFSFIDGHVEWLKAYSWRTRSGHMPQSDTAPPCSIAGGCLWHPY